MPLPKLTKAVHDKLVEAAATGCTLDACAKLIGLNKNTVRRWLAEGRDPDNKKQRSLRDDIMRARAFAETEALKNIQMAGLDPDNWRASAWYLTHVTRGVYNKSAREVNQPQVYVTMSDIAKDLADDGDYHQNGEALNGVGSNRISDVISEEGLGSEECTS